MLGFTNGCPSSSVTQTPVAGTTTKTSSAVLLDVNPEGLATSLKVEYGTTESYGLTTTMTPAANTEGTQSETVPLSGLLPCTTYHYQAESENEANEGKPGLGGDQTVTTACIYTGEYTININGPEKNTTLNGLFGEIGTYTNYHPDKKSYEEGLEGTGKEERKLSSPLPAHLKTLTGILTAGPGTLTSVAYNNTFKYWEAVISGIEWIEFGTKEWRVSLEGEYTNAP